MAKFTDKFFLQSIRRKVIAAFLIGAIAIGLAWIVTRVGFEEMLSTVNKLSTPNEKLKVVNTLFRSITQLDQLQRVQAIKNPDKPYAAFKKGSEYLVKTLDTLRNLSANNPLQVQRLDSMQTILRSRDKLFLSYLKLRKDLVHNEALSKRIHAVSNYIAKNNKPKIDTSIVITNQRYVTTTTIPTADSLVHPPVKKKQRKSFFGRLFSSRKTEPLPPAVKQVEEELKIQVDTLAVAKQDSSIWKIQKMMRRMEREQHQRTTQLLNRELALVNTNNQLHTQLLAILHVIEAEEIHLDRQNSQQATEVVRASISRMNSIMIIFFLVAAFLAYLILIDIARSHKYRKQLIAAKEEAEHLGQVKQRFLANMSHEIRTPLQAIIGFAEQVYQQPQPKREALEAIYRSAEHLLQIVNEVLDYSRITSGKFTFEQQPFNVQQLVSGVVETMRLPAEQKQLALVLESTIPSTLFVSGDAFRLRQVLYNLLGNAIKFTQRGRVTLQVSCMPVRKAIEITFAVIDTGIGIPNSELERIFYLFEQADASVVRTHGGTGLGLSIAKTLVEGQNGSIEVSSEPDEGSCFVVKLPFMPALAPVPEPALVSASNQSIKAITAGKPNGKVLVVDDDAFILRLCETILNKYGIINTCTADANAVLHQTWDSDIKLVLLDIRMPQINGLELCRELRKKLGKEVKVVALTAQALPEEREIILAEGFDGILMKPFREHELLTWIHSQNITGAASPTHSFSEPDLSMLIKITDNDEEQLRIILNQFILDTQQDLEKLNPYLIDCLPKPTREIIHRLTGRIGQVGAKELAARFRTLEAALNQQQPLEPMLPELEILQKEAKELVRKIHLKVKSLEEIMVK
ncbi:hybrid sensor histidine kinase/response regulator [Adhaeribacter arboris]|uniref:histidine kinase n=1 Tax=Adhaeribacter arboris TaxID=2072846 RepID=A0A2T2YJ84_9BACT|nr:ATP-binding protein [Adhaeribacter arboris]PSR55561.1 hybrid sensor histidine kinase/response regulator [Adhaeribacter arboris]